MSGVALGIGACWGCKHTFSFDPDTVPSISIDPETNLPPDLGGNRQRAVKRPICPSCCRAANVRRAGAGLPLISEEDTTQGLYMRQ